MDACVHRHRHGRGLTYVTAHKQEDSCVSVNVYKCPIVYIAACHLPQIKPDISHSKNELQTVG